MAAVYPFKGIRFKSAPDSLAGYLCPPYAAIGPEEAARLRKNPLNAVHLELPEGESAKPYEAAARVWRRWREEGVLAEDGEESFYVLEENFSAQGRLLKRLGLFAALGLAGRDSQALVPHERTLEIPVRHRLRLLEEARANTSPIFTICRDPGGRVLRFLKRLRSSRPPVVKSRAGEEAEFKLWRVAGGSDVEKLKRLLSRQKIFIADGHHRLEAAKRFFAENRSAGARMILAGVYPDSQKSLVVLATHRIVRGAAVGRRARRLSRLVPQPSLKALWRRLRAEKNPYAFGLWEGGFYLGLPRAADGCRTGLSVEWIGRHLLGGASLRGVRYHPDPEFAVASARKWGGSAIVVKPPALRDLFRASGRGLLPEKSTYFTPKIPTGILFREIP